MNTTNQKRNIKTIDAYIRLQLNSVQEFYHKQAFKRQLSCCKTFEEYNSLAYRVSGYLNTINPVKNSIGTSSQYLKDEFDRAVLDFILGCCEDIARVPNIEEIVTEKDKKDFEERDSKKRTTLKFKTKIDVRKHKGMLTVSADCQSGKSNFKIYNGYHFTNEVITRAIEDPVYKI